MKLSAILFFLSICSFTRWSPHDLKKAFKNRQSHNFLAVVDRNYVSTAFLQQLQRSFSYNFPETVVFFFLLDGVDTRYFNNRANKWDLDRFYLDWRGLMNDAPCNLDNMLFVLFALKDRQFSAQMGSNVALYISPEELNEDISQNVALMQQGNYEQALNGMFRNWAYRLGQGQAKFEASQQFENLYNPKESSGFENAFFHPFAKPEVVQTNEESSFLPLIIVAVIFVVLVSFIFRMIGRGVTRGASGPWFARAPSFPPSDYFSTHDTFTLSCGHAFGLNMREEILQTRRCPLCSQYSTSNWGAADRGYNPISMAHRTLRGVFQVFNATFSKRMSPTFTTGDIHNRTENIPPCYRGRFVSDEALPHQRLFSSTQECTSNPLQNWEFKACEQPPINKFSSHKVTTAISSNSPLASPKKTVGVTGSW